MGRLEEVPSMKRPRTDPPVQIYWISKNARSRGEVVDSRYECQFEELGRRVATSYTLNIGHTADRRCQDRQPLRERSWRSLSRFNRTVPLDLASVLHLWSRDLSHPSQRRPGRI